MLKLILSAVRSALRAAWHMLKAVATLPFQILAGGSNMPPIEEQDSQTLDIEDIDAIAARIMAWAVGCVRSRSMQPPPESLPLRTRTWMRRLDLGEATLMVDAGRMNIAAHICGSALRGVPPSDLNPTLIPDWRRSNSAVHDAEIGKSERWRRMQHRNRPEAAVSDAQQIPPKIASVEPEDDDPAYQPKIG